MTTEDAPLGSPPYSHLDIAEGLPPLPAADAELVERHLDNLPYPCCSEMSGPIWLAGRYCGPVCPKHGHRLEPTIEALPRPAVTEAMVEAGAKAVLDFNRQEFPTSDDIAFAREEVWLVFAAMLAAKEAG